MIFHNVDKALSEPDTQIFLFGKPEIAGHRRLAVALARGATIEEAKEKALRAAAAVEVEM
jgi:phosphoribosylglycinamide formyltransferase 2